MPAVHPVLLALGVYPKQRIYSFKGACHNVHSDIIMILYNIMALVTNRD